MDDLLERPTYTVPANAAASGAAEDVPENANQSSDEEDGGPDWTKLPSSSAARPVIPKRGDKEYEPTRNRGTDLQQYKLDRVRDAMLSALDVERTISSKNVSYGIWIPDIARVHVTLARGNHLLSVGHSAPWVRDDQQESGKGAKVSKRVELLPEEALYLIERGSMFCWKQGDPAVPIEPGSEERLGVPMTVQQAFAEMIGREDITLEKYQVFSYLKRLGYVVIRAKAPSTFYPLPPPYNPPTRMGPSKNIFSRIKDVFLGSLRALFSGQLDWWKPLQVNKFLHRLINYPTVFSSLRILNTGYGIPLFRKPNAADVETGSPYKIFYNLYKPATLYRKTSPPPPDFQIVVIDGRITPMPTLQELISLFDQVPNVPPPVPRKRNNPPTGNQKPTLPPSAPQASAHIQKDPRSLYSWILSWLSSVLFRRSSHKHPGGQSQKQPYRPNPFQMLKLGKKIIVVAAVDAGMISFFRFGQGGFEDWPMA